MTVSHAFEMSGKTEEELVALLTLNREDHSPDAIAAAEAEVRARGITADSFIEIKESLENQLLSAFTLEMLKVNAGIRFVHFLVDSSIIFLLYFVVLAFLPERWFQDSGAGNFNQSMSFITLYVLYYGGMEVIFKKTAGKFLTGTKVVTSDGSDPGIIHIISRTFSRLIPFDQLSFLFTRNGIHDLVSRTIVIRI